MPLGAPRVLITSSRMPFAVDEIHKFGEAGFEVFAADTFAHAPGSHSKHVVASLVAPAPDKHPLAYVAALEQFVEEHRIELLVPCFEEVFYITRHSERLAGMVELFAPCFETLVRLHDKLTFLGLVRELGMAVPPTVVVHGRDDLQAATRELGSFFARPSFSRGGVDLYTNTGLLAGELELEDCAPTPENPWLVQGFIEGLDLCSFSVARHGHLVAHLTYVHPHTFQGAGGITFESIDAPDVLDAVRRIVEATGYHGQISMDFMRTAQGLVPIECNPRPTSGVSLMATDAFIDAVRGRGNGSVTVVRAGERRKISVGLLRNMLVDWRSLPSSVAALVNGGDDIYAPFEDLLPAIYQFVGYFHLLRARRSERAEHPRAQAIKFYFRDICWDGSPIP